MKDTPQTRAAVTWTTVALLAVTGALAVFAGSAWVLAAPVVILGYAFYVLRAWPREEEFEEHAPATRSWHDGQPHARAMAEEDAVRAETEARRREWEEDVAFHRRSREEALATYDPRSDAGPPPNAPFP